MRGGGTFYAELLLLFVALAEVGILHLLAAAAAGCAVLCHFDLGQVALAAIDVVAALADIADDAFVLHAYHLSLQAVCPQRRFFIQAGPLPGFTRRPGWRPACGRPPGRPHRGPRCRSAPPR